MRRLVCAAALALLGPGLPGPLGCASLPALDPNTCGNGVIDEGEDCDSFAATPEVDCSGLACHCGDAGTASACRYDARGKNACPAGWGQGEDLLCRKPSGSFRALGAALDTGDSHALLADFDGDGRDEVVSLGVADLLGNRVVSVHFLETTGAVQKVVTVPSLLATPAARALSSAARSDLLFGFNGGVGMLAGQFDQTLSPIAFPTLTIPDPSGLSRVKAFPVRFADQPLLYRVAVLTSNATQSLVIRDNREDQTVQEGCEPNVQSTPHGSPILLLDPRDTPDSLLAFATGGLTDGPTGALCDRVAMAFQGESRITVLSPCQAGTSSKVEWNGQSSTDPPLYVTLPAPLPATASADIRLFFADADGDQRVDLILTTTDRTLVAYGLADGSFSSVSGAKTGDNQASELTRIERCSGGRMMMMGAATCSCLQTDGSLMAGGSCPRPPLAVADINGDGVIDYVTPQSVMLSEPAEIGGKKATVYASHYDKIGGEWTEAVVADFTGDGAPDVVAAQYTPTLDMLISTNHAQYFNRSTLPTSAPASLLSVGDADGDHLPDLAFKLAGVRGDTASGGAGAAGATGTTTTTSASGDSLAVSFGQLNRPTTTPANLGQLGQISQVLIGPLADRTLGSVDTLADIGVASLTEDNTLARFSILYGDSSRELLAPLGLSNFQCNIRGTSAGLVVGQFTEDKQLDVAVLGLDPSALAAPGQQQGATNDEGARLWLFSGLTQGVLASPTVSDSPTETKGLQFRFAENAGKAGQLPSQGAGMMAPISSGDLEALGVHVGAIVVAGNLDNPGNDALDEVVVIAPIASDFATTSRVIVWEGKNSANSTTVFSVASYFDVARPVIGDSQAELVDVDGDGLKDLLLLSTGVGDSGELVVFWNDGKGGLAPAPVTIPVKPGGASPQGFTLVNARGQKRRDLLVISESGAALLALGTTPGSLPAELPEFAAENAISGTSVVAGDITGDGIDDIVVARATGLQVFEGIPRLK